MASPYRIFPCVNVQWPSISLQILSSASLRVSIILFHPFSPFYLRCNSPGYRSPLIKVPWWYGSVKSSRCFFDIFRFKYTRASARGYKFQIQIHAIRQIQASLFQEEIHPYAQNYNYIQLTHMPPASLPGYSARDKADNLQRRFSRNSLLLSSIVNQVFSSCIRVITWKSRIAE